MCPFLNPIFRAAIQPPFFSENSDDARWNLHRALNVYLCEAMGHRATLQDAGARTFGGDMDKEPKWTPLAAGTLLCALSALLLLVLIGDRTQSRNSPEIDSRSVNADMPLILRLLR